MNSPFSWGRLTSRRFVRVATAVIVPLALGVILYNATAVDRVPPSVNSIAVTTPPNSSLALTLTAITVTFSEDVREDTAEKAFSITPNIAGKLAWSGRQKMIFTPSAKLPLSTQFVVQEGAGVTDLAGNTATEPLKQMKFTTIGAPAVKATNPAPDAENVPVDTKIVITFDRNMDPTSVAGALTITPDFQFEPAWSGAILTLTPAKPLRFSMEYTLRINGGGGEDHAVDTDGNALPPFQVKFKTVGQGLSTLARIPAPGVAGVNVRTPIAVVYDGPIDPASLTPTTFQITPPVTGDVRAVPLPNDSAPAGNGATPEANVLTFTPSQPLAAHTTYTVTIKAGVRRTDGQAAAGDSWTFTTGEPATTAQNQIVFLSDRGGVNNLWLMNPDGTNPRQLTTELAPVSGFDVATDGSKIVYTTGGVVKRLTLSSHDVTTMTGNDRFEYAPSFTPDGTKVLLGRRDQAGNDQGYWLVALGGGEQQLTDTGAPGLGSVAVTGDGLTGDPGLSSWAPRTAWSKDGTKALVVRGDNTLELIDATNPANSRQLDLQGAGNPVYLKADDSFYAVARQGDSGSWAYWKVSMNGDTSQQAPAVGDLAGATTGTDGELALLAMGSDGASHLGLVSTAPGAVPGTLLNDATYDERSPSFSPDGSMVVFGRVFAQDPTRSSGIWIVKVDGTGLANLATDGTYPRWIP